MTHFLARILISNCTFTQQNEIFGGLVIVQSHPLVLFMKSKGKSDRREGRKRREVRERGRVMNEGGAKFLISERGEIFEAHERRIFQAH